MDKRIRKVMYANPTFDSIEKEYEEEGWKDPGPGLARAATEFVLSPFYTRSYDDAMKEPPSTGGGPRRSIEARASRSRPFWSFWSCGSTWSSRPERGSRCARTPRTSWSSRLKR